MWTEYKMKLLRRLSSWKNLRYIISRHSIYANRNFDNLYPQWQSFSLTSHQQFILHQKSNTPIKLSTSPINDYKTTSTFKDDNMDAKTSVSKQPIIIIGSVLLLILVLVMVFGKEEPLDIFSTEVLGQFEEKISNTFNLDKNDAENDIK